MRNALVLTLVLTLSLSTSNAFAQSSDSDVVALAAAVEEMKGVIEALRSERDTLTDQLAAAPASTTREARGPALRRLRAQLSAKETELAAAQSTIVGLRADITRGQEQMAAVMARLDQLESGRSVAPTPVPASQLAPEQLASYEPQSFIDPSVRLLRTVSVGVRPSHPAPYTNPALRLEDCGNCLHKQNMTGHPIEHIIPGTAWVETPNGKPVPVTGRVIIPPYTMVYFQRPEASSMQARRVGAGTTGAVYCGWWNTNSDNSPFLPGFGTCPELPGD